MKHKIKVIVSIAAVLMSLQTSFAAEDKSDQLGLFTTIASDCPVSRTQVDNAIEGEFLRARIKPSRSLDFNLNVNVSCLSINNVAGNHTGYAINYEIRYGTQIEDGMNVLIETPSYGSMLIAGPNSSSSQFIVNAIKESTSSALTDYLKMIME
ncbi:hypothetical protein L4D09_28385 [Photobacterium makurazakiensis]|uniref:hypothetical protein n=1 Tax=Photobacterium makurazakiensis TaxID=2910234 RepID=UPI003D0B1681